MTTRGLCFALGGAFVKAARRRATEQAVNGGAETEAKRGGGAGTEWGGRPFSASERCFLQAEDRLLGSGLSWSISVGLRDGNKGQAMPYPPPIVNNMLRAVKISSPVAFSV